MPPLISSGGEKLNNSVKKVTLSGLFIALGFLLPYITGNIQGLGVNLLPMHLPILIGGFVLGWKYGFLIGFVTPLLRSVLIGMPPMLIAIPMAFELGIYGMITGLLYNILSKNKISILISLILAMISGRIAWGVISYLIFFIDGIPFTMDMFIAGAFANSLLGIIIQLILVPMIVIALERAGVLRDEPYYF